MAQARKNHRRSEHDDNRIPGWLMFLTGLGIGLFVALLVFVNGSDGARLGSGLKGLFTPAGKQETRTVPQPKPAPKREKTKFDFYTILPGIESVLPNMFDSGAGEQPTKTENEVRYILQAASYANFTDADRLKAELALAGLEAYIEKITIEKRGDYYRVRLGPFDRLDKLDEANKGLAKLGIRALRLKVKKPKG